MIEKKILEMEEKTQNIETEQKIYSLDVNVSISNKSKFKDNIWDFTDADKQRLNSVGDSKLKLDWSRYKDLVSSELIESTKVVCYFFIKNPKIFSRRNTTQRGYKHNTIVQKFKIFLTFLEKVCLSNTVELLNNQKVTIISSLSSLSLSEIRAEAILISKNTTEIKSVLKAFCNPTIQKYLPSKVTWNTADINRLKFAKIQKDKTVENFSDQPLDDKIFSFLSKEATQDVLVFLELLGIESAYNIEKNFDTNQKIKKYKNNFIEMFSSYIDIRVEDRKYSLQLGKRRTRSINHIEFRAKYGIAAKEFLNDLQRFHRAAIFIFCLYIGVRYSEAVSFKSNCLEEIKEGLWVVRGTITKNEDVNKLEGTVEWVACPIVRDAVKVLEEFQRFTFNSYIISPTYSVYLNQKDLPYSNEALNSLLNDYKNQVDKEDRFKASEYTISSHRLRHSIARQLIKAKLGIPYISNHLKHIHSQIMQAQNYINNVTISYGNISKELFNNATTIQKVKKEVVYDLYHPDSPVAGKNSDAFKERRKAFFQGMQADGMTIEEILDYLAVKGVPFADVGLGYCGGKKDIVLANGNKEKPPCIGQLKCNPTRCHNAIIPKNKVAHWKNVYKHSKGMLINPLFSHLRSEHETFLKEAELVLKELKVNLEDL